MALTEFKDYPDTTTPANAQNLNKNFSELQTQINNSTKITFNNEWLICHKLYGGGILMLVPILNPNRNNPKINITKAQIFTANDWQNVTVYGVGYQTVTTTHLYLRFNEGSLNLTSGSAYLIRLVGTIECS